LLSMMTNRRNRWNRGVTLEIRSRADDRRNTLVMSLVLAVVAGTIDWATAMITRAVAFNMLAPPCSLVYRPASVASFRHHRVLISLSRAGGTFRHRHLSAGRSGSIISRVLGVGTQLLLGLFCFVDSTQAASPGRTGLGRPR
jgi:hypothetical protein